MSRNYTTELIKKELTDFILNNKYSSFDIYKCVNNIKE